MPDESEGREAKRLNMEVPANMYYELRRLALQQTEQRGYAVSVTRLIREAVASTYGIETDDPQWGGWRGGAE